MRLEAIVRNAAGDEARSVIVIAEAGTPPVTVQKTPAALVPIIGPTIATDGNEPGPWGNYFGALFDRAERDSHAIFLSQYPLKYPVEKHVHYGSLGSRLSTIFARGLKADVSEPLYEHGRLQHEDFLVNYSVPNKHLLPQYRYTQWQDSWARVVLGDDPDGHSLGMLWQGTAWQSYDYYGYQSQTENINAGPRPQAMCMAGAAALASLGVPFTNWPGSKNPPGWNHFLMWDGRRTKATSWRGMLDLILENMEHTQEPSGHIPFIGFETGEYNRVMNLLGVSRRQDVPKDVRPASPFHCGLRNGSLVRGVLYSGLDKARVLPLVQKSTDFHMQFILPLGKPAVGGVEPLALPYDANVHPDLVQFNAPTADIGPAPWALTLAWLFHETGDPKYRTWLEGIIAAAQYAWYGDGKHFNEQNSLMAHSAWAILNGVGV